MTPDTVLFSRLQFAFTLAYHILWPAFTIGLSGFLVVLNAAWLRTRRPVYQELLEFWTRIFALGFGMGVVTGVVISYELGANWSRFALATSGVLGPLFTFEVLSAFFLEAGFIGIVLFGARRVGERIHFAATVIVALGTMTSAFWIIAANSWMQTPQGTELVDGRFVVTDWLKVIFNPSMPYRLVHMVLASYITGAFLVIGVSSVFMLRKRNVEFARTAYSLCFWQVLILVPLQIFVGDAHGLNTREHQPMKLAAIEGRWETAKEVPLTLFAIPRQDQERNDYGIEIPVLGSLILTHDLHGEVKGLKEVSASKRPPVIVVFFAFRAMVGVGFSLLGITLLGAFLRWRGRLFDTRWFQVLTMLTTPFGFIATVAGWIVTEVGRQPYVVYNYMLTADASSPIPAGSVVASLTMFFIVYNILMLAFFWYAGRMVWLGPPAPLPVPTPVPAGALHATGGA